MTTSKLSTQLSFADSGLLPEDTLANLFPKPGSEEARKMTVTSGLRCLESYVKPDPLMSCVKMLLATSRWASTQCYLIWKEKVTPANRLLFQLSPKMPNIDVTGSGFWLTPTAVQMEPTEGRREKRKAYRESIGRKDVAGCLAEQVATPKMWPTPRAMTISNKMERLTPEGRMSADGKQRFGLNLQDAVKMWPTPRASDGLRENMSMVTHMKVAQREDGGFQTLHSEIAKAEEVLDLSGSLNPQWVEWLMGYPIGWTDLKD